VSEHADGYFAIVLPDEDVWQGFYLDQTHDFRAGRYVEWYDAHLDDFGAVVESGKVFAHLDNREQAIISLLSPVGANYFAKADLPNVHLTATAIARLSGHRFFWIEGRWLPDGNYHAILGILTAQTVLDAQLEVVNLPSVYAMIHRGHFGSHP
jgi:hypothetical protein